MNDIDANWQTDPQDKGLKQLTLGVRGSKVKVSGGWS